MIKMAILGHGVVGSGVAEILLGSKAHIEKSIGEEIDVKYILDIRDFDGLPYSDRFNKDFSVIENDPEVKIVAEVMGGVNPAFDFVSRCLKAGKSVCTSNKELVAVKGYALNQIAQANGVNFLFEASVGGGIPVLTPIRRCLGANKITEILGILNGTTNFILNKMIQEHMEFDTALKIAQNLGFAEKNPAADIEGPDACRKVCILATLAYGKHVYPEQVTTEGIVNVTLDDVAYAASADCVVKLIGRVKQQENGQVLATVYPALLPLDNQLSHVDGVFNAILVRGDAVGEVMFYGPGAGKLPTASAVVADMIDCAKHLGRRIYEPWADGQPDYIADPTLDETRLYVYGKVDAKAAAVAEIQSVFPGAILLSKPDASDVEIAFLTDTDTEQALQKKLAGLTQVSISRTMHMLK